MIKPVCPICKGTGYLLPVFIKKSSIDKMIKNIEKMFCSQCKGSGKITKEQMDWYRDGIKLKEERIARNIGIRKEAKRLGISVAILSKIEHGIINPKVNYPYLKKK